MSDLVRRRPPGPRPPDDGFDRVLRGARRRRLRTLLAGAGAFGGVALLAAAVVALPGLAPGTNGLTPTNDRGPGRTPAPAYASDVPTPSVTPSPPLTPSATPPAAGPVDGPVATPAPDVVPPAGRGPVASDDGGVDEPAPEEPVDTPTPDPSETPDPTPSDSPSPSPSPTGDPAQREPMTFAFESQSLVSPCQGTAWCLRVDVTGSAVDASRTLRYHACRGSQDGAGVLHLTRTVEADFRVSAGGAIVWRWMRLKPVSSPHDLTVPRLECAVWSTVWHRVDSAGQPVAPGTYTAEGMLYVSDFAIRWYSVTFTVT
jgi:hypothetical protein